MKWTYFTAVLLLAVAVKAVIHSLSIGDSLAILGFIAAHIYLLFLETKKVLPVNEQVKKDMDDMKSKIDKISLHTALRK